MSIIEDTLKKMQGKQGDTGTAYNGPGTTPIVGGNVSKNTGHRTFVIITIVLSVLGAAVYIGFDRYQEKLKAKKNILSFNLNTQIMPIVEIQKPLIITGPETKQKGPDKQPVATTEQTSTPRLLVKKQKKQFSGSFRENIQNRNATSPKTIKTDGLSQKTSDTIIFNKQELKKIAQKSGPEKSEEKPVAVIGPIPETRKVKQETKEIALVNEQQKSVMQPEATKEQFSKAIKDSSPEKDTTSPETTKVVESSQKTSNAPIVKEHETKQEPEKVVRVSKRQNPDWQPNVAGDTSLLIEEYVTEKQLSRAKHLINIGAYKKAIETLKPVIDRSAGTWEAHLLMGAAYLGMEELYYAEAYLNMGIAMNGKQPQLWIQRAIVEQQRGEHETALEMLHEAEMLAPDMPKVPLNVGYSYDAIGEKELATKSYRSFLKLVEGNPTYAVVRLKVLERLTYLK